MCHDVPCRVNENNCPLCNSHGVGIYDGSGTIVCKQCNLNWHYCKIHNKKVKRPAPNMNNSSIHNKYNGHPDCSCISEWGSAFF